MSILVATMALVTTFLTATSASTASSLSPPGATAAGATTYKIPSNLLGKDITVIPTKKKIVALTFDAGGNADSLTSILATLKTNRVKATFLLTGSWAKKYPGSVKKIVAAGHRLGNHSATHPDMTKLSDAAATKQITTARAQILAAGGTDPKPFFRFPFGARNAHTIKLVNKSGYVAVRWTVDSLGWKGTSGGMTKTKVVNRVVGAARPGEIALMHVGSHPTDRSMLDAAALPSIITKLKAKGYSFVTLNALLTAVTTPPPPPLPSTCDRLAWRTAPFTVTHNSALPIPVVTGIRSGSHPECRYDRIVFDHSGSTPGYDVRYVTSVVADGSGEPVTVPGGGTKFLQIRLNPAQAHTDAGAPTVVPSSKALGYPRLKGYAMTGDFEAYVTVVLGLNATAKVRVGELAGRLYVDVSY